MMARMSDGEPVEYKPMKVKDAAMALYFFRAPLEGMSDDEKKDTIREMFMNYRPAFNKVYAQYPELTAHSLKELMAEDPYGYVSKDIKEFADAIPDWKMLKNKTKTYYWVRALGGLGAVALTMFSTSYLALFSTFAAFLIMHGYTSKKLAEYRPQCMFKREFEKDDNK